MEPPPDATSGDRGARRRRAIRGLSEVAVVAVLVGALTAVCVAIVHTVPIFGLAERWLADLRVALLSEARPQHPGIVLITITEDTLAGMPYRSPVDRTFLAAVLKALDDAGVAAIGLDMLIDQQTETAKDDALARAIASLKAPTVIAFADQNDGLTDRQSDFLADFVARTGVRPGLVTLLTDPFDGTVDWIYAGRDTRAGPMPGFVPAMAQSVGISAPATTIPLLYRPGPDARTPAFRAYPAHLIAHLPKAWLTGRIVLIGSDLPHTDRHRTPYSMLEGAEGSTRPGVEIHAHGLAQVLDGESAPHVSLDREIAITLLVAAFAMAIGSLTMPLSLHLLVGTASFVAFWVGGFALFAVGGWLVPLVAPSLAFALVFAVGNAFWNGRTRRQKNFIRTAFSRFIAPALVAELIRNPETLRLGGEKREITCLFTDIAGFTGWMETADPEHAVALLNDYLDRMCQIAFDHGGTVNKIIGDALYVIFGAPARQTDHARRAVQCAVAMDAFAAVYAAEKIAAGIPFGATRIGVHSGFAVVGNFGGNRHFDYTAYGDTVNTASRLEGANRYLGTRVCISAATARAAGDGILFRPIGAVVLSGRTEPIDAFEPIDPGDDRAGYLQEYLEAFAPMRDHDQGLGGRIALLARQWPDDSLIGFHARRLDEGETGVVIRLGGK